MGRIKYLFFLLLSGVIFSCADKNLYDDSSDVASTAELFADSISVSDDFDWSMTKTVSLTVSVDDQYNGENYYKVGVYDANPLFDEGANLLGEGNAKSGQDFTSSLVVPKATNLLYIEQTDPTGKIQVSSVDITDVTSVSYAFGTESVTSTISTQSASLRSLIKTTSATATTAPSVPSDAIEVTGSSFTISADNSSRKNYVINGDYTGTLTFNDGWGQGISLYIVGNWTNTDNKITIGANDKVYILSGGSANIKSISANNSSAFYNYGSLTAGSVNFTNSTTFENDGTLNVTDDANFTASVTLTNTGTATYSSAFVITNEFTFNNSGTVTMEDKATFSNGSFVNTGTATFADLVSTTSSTTIQNDGTMTATSSELTNATLLSNCHTTIGTFSTTGATVYVAGGGLLDITTLSSGGTNFNLAATSILSVSSEATFSSNKNYMTGTGSSLALAKMTKVTSGTNGITYSGNLQIECSDHTANKQYNTYYTLTSPAAFVPTGETSVEIASTDCNDGGNNVTAGTPSDQTTTSVTLGTYSYAFEDNWPSYGDFDMNDFVSDIALTRVQNTDNQTTELVINAKIRAVGASKHIAAAIQLDDIEASAVKSVTYSNTNIVGTNIPLSSTGVESGQTYVVVPICDDAHAAFGLSTPAFVNTSRDTSSYVDPISVTITIDFNTAQKLFTNDDLNVFIVTAGYKTSARTEVHLNERVPTDKANTSQFSSANLKSSSDPYRSHENLMWGLCIPESFDYPYEVQNITDKYDYFEPWAQSDGTSYTTWYEGN